MTWLWSAWPFDKPPRWWLQGAGVGAAAGQGGDKHPTSATSPGTHLPGRERPGRPWAESQGRHLRHAQHLQCQEHFSRVMVLEALSVRALTHFSDCSWAGQHQAHFSSPRSEIRQGWQADNHLESEHYGHKTFVMETVTLRSAPPSI